MQTTLIPDTKSGKPDMDSVKVNGVITSTGVNNAVSAEVRLYDQLLRTAQSEACDVDILET